MDALDEIRRLIDVLDDFWKPLFIVLFFTGVRIGEAAELKQRFSRGATLGTTWPIKQSEKLKIA